jgi:hypothetical protein
MSYIPSELKLTDGTTNIQLTTIAGGGQLQTTNPTGNMVISATLSDPANYVALNAPNVAIVSDVLSIVSASQVGIQYTLPTNVQPTDDSILVFQSNGSSTFQPNGGGGAVNAVLNTQYPTSATAGSVLVMSGGDAVSSSPSDGIIVDGGEINLTSNSINILRPGFPSGGSLFIDGNDDLQLVNNTNGNYKLTANGTMTVTGGGGVQLVSQNGNTIHINPNGQTIIQSNNPTLFQELTSFKYSSLLQQASGEFSIINENADSSLELRANTGGVLINSFAGLSFNGIGSLNSSGSEIVLSNGDGSLQLSSKFNDVIVDTEGGGKFQVNQGSEFQGDMTINKVDPQINFNNTDYPTQLCNIAFESASQELIIEHHSPDLASKCNIRLGTNDINIQSTFSALNAGNINLETGTGYVNVNQYKLPNTNPIADGQVLSCDIDGTSSWVSSPIPQTTYTYWVSNQGLDTNNGSIINPFLTVGRAITEANTLLDTDKVVINVMAGQYNEFSGITITKNNITINGGTSIPSQTVFDGIITYAIDNTGGADITSNLYGLTVRGVVYAGSSANNGSYVLGACILGTLQSGIVPIVNSYSLAGNRDITVSNCVVYAYDTHALTTVSGRINATATLFTQSSLVLNNTSAVLEATGNGLFALFGCQAFSLNNQATNVPPIISLANTIVPSSSHTFNSCTIQYVFATVNTGTLNKVCIGCTNTVGISMLAYNNLLIGEGTRITNGGVQYVIISKQGAGAVVLQYGQNLCGATVHRYATALSKTQLVTAIA